MRKFYSLFLTALLGLVSLSANAVNITINVDDPSRVSVKVNNGAPEELVAGDNHLEVAAYQPVQIEAQSGAFLTKVVRSMADAEDVEERINNMSSCYLYVTDANEGATWTVTSVNSDDARDGSCRVYVDNVSKVQIQRSGSYSYVTLEEGWNDVKFMTEGELPLLISPTSGNVLYQVKHKGEVVAPTYSTTWSISPANGDEIEVLADFPDEDVPLTFTYSDEEAKGFITSVRVNNEAVENYNEEGFTVKLGSSITISGNTQDYKLNSFTVNGNTVGFYGSYTFTVTEETTINVDAHKYGIINATINIDHPENVVVYKGYSYQNNILEMEEGVNAIALSESNAMIQIKPATDCTITSVSDGTTEYTASYDGSYTVTVTEGMELVVTSATLDESRDGACRIYVDEASKVVVRRSGSYTVVNLVDGWNDVKFMTATELPLMVSAATYGTSLYQVKLNGEAVEAQSGYWNLSPANGDEIEILANFPDVNVPLTFIYADEEAKGFITSVLVDNEAVEGYNEEGFTVKLGSSVTVKVNMTDYKLDSFKVNDQEVSISTYSPSYTFTVKEETTINVAAHKYGTVNATINIDNPENVLVYKGYTYLNDLVTLEAGDNAIELSETNASLTIKAASGCFITSVSDGTTEYTANYNGEYSVTVTEGMVLTIKSGAIERNQTVVFYVDDLSAAQYYFSLQRSDRAAVDLVSGYNEVKMYDGDNPFNLGFAGSAYANVYQNGETVAPQYAGGSTYSLSLADNDVVKIFLACDPATYNVAFEVAEEVVTENVTVVRDRIQTVESWTEGFSAFQGTEVSLKVTEGNEVIVEVNGTALEAGEDGSFTFTVDADTKVAIKAEEAIGTGIQELEAALNGTSDVYNLQGICIARKATAEQIRTLPAGLYVIDGKKVIKR